MLSFFKFRKIEKHRYVLVPGTLTRVPGTVRGREGREWTHHNVSRDRERVSLRHKIL